MYIYLILSIMCFSCDESHLNNAHSIVRINSQTTCTLRVKLHGKVTAGCSLLFGIMRYHYAEFQKLTIVVVNFED
jgi:hypothetical protein